MKVIIVILAIAILPGILNYFFDLKKVGIKLDSINKKIAARTKALKDKRA